ncbi:NACHT domain-containing protein [Virgisporangium aliadipatigenens]|nr:NACHT domain-containing protein [Virgisporangium aliadipatigenens]
MAIRWRRRALLAGVALLIAVPTMLLWTEDGQNVAAAAGLSVAVASVVVSWAAWRHPRTASAEPLDAAATALAGAQLRQWTAEQRARQVLDPYPLPVRWSVSARAREVMASWSSIRGAPGAAPMALDGSYDTIADLFAGADAPRRLVVLGEPGAGKSMLVLHLTVELLRRRTPDAPVPVLLTVAGWDPATPLEEWIAERVAADHRSLARPMRAPDGTERSTARELLATGRILPVLDGLDEIAAGRHEAALAGMAAAGTHVVVTCRTAAYEAAVDAHGPLPAAAVIELLPLRPSDVARYLVDGTDRPVPRWNPVLAHLADGAATPLTHALTTPLTAWLARAAYRHRGTDPAHLLHAGATRHDLERHLLGLLIPAVYGIGTASWPARTPEEIVVIRRRLAWLARHLQERRTYDLAWWELHRVFPRPVAALITGVAFGSAVGALGLLGLVIAGSSNQPLIGMLALLMAGHGSGRLMRWTVIVYLGVLLVSFDFVIVATQGEHTPFVAVVEFAVGCVAGVAVGFSVSAPRRIVLTPRGAAQGLGLLLGGVAVVLAGFALAERVTGLLGEERTFVGFVLRGLSGLVLSYLPFVLLMSRFARGLVRAADDGQRAVTPARLLAEDRAAGLLLTVAVASVFAVLMAGQVQLSTSSYWIYAVLLAATRWVVVAVVFWLAVATLSPWGRFTVLRVLLAARGRTPLRLMAFLREAHDRGVLRQSGGVYQFRHSRIQDHLAGDP